MRGDGFFNPDSGENALCALLPYVELVFNTLHKDQGIRFIGNDSHTTMSFSGVHICPSCTREMNWRRDLRSFFPLHGSQCVSISIAARMKAARVVCSQKECLHIAEKELVPLTFPTFFFVELSRDERSAEPGIPDSFILELSVLIREVRYELLSVVYRIPGRTAHFNCDAFREFNSENTWFKVDDLLGHVTKINHPSTEVFFFFFFDVCFEVASILTFTAYIGQYLHEQHRTSRVPILLVYCRAPTTPTPTASDYRDPSQLPSSSAAIPTASSDAGVAPSPDTTSATAAKDEALKRAERNRVAALALQARRQAEETSKRGATDLKKNIPAHESYFMHFGKYSKKSPPLTLLQVFQIDPPYVLDFILGAEVNGTLKHASLSVAINGASGCDKNYAALWSALQSLAKVDDHRFNSLRKRVSELIELSNLDKAAKISVLSGPIQLIERPTILDLITVHDSKLADKVKWKHAQAPLVDPPNSRSFHGTWKSSLGDNISVRGATVTILLLNVTSNKIATTTIHSSNAIDPSDRIFSIGRWIAVQLSSQHVLWQLGNGRHAKTVCWERVDPPSSLSALLNTLSVPGASSVSELHGEAIAQIATAVPYQNAFSVLLEGRSISAAKAREKSALAVTGHKKHQLSSPQQCGFCNHRHFFTSKLGLQLHWRICPDAIAGRCHTSQSRKGRMSFLDRFRSEHGGLCVVNFGGEGGLHLRQHLRLLWAVNHIIRNAFSGNFILGLKWSTLFKKGQGGSNTFFEESREFLESMRCYSRLENFETPVEFSPLFASRLRGSLARTVLDYLIGPGSGRLFALPRSSMFYRHRGHGALPDSLLPSRADCQASFLRKVKTELLSGEYRTWGNLVRFPPLPCLQRRSAVTLAPGADANNYCLEPVLCWDPIAMWPELSCRCLYCKSSSIGPKGWSEGKTIHSLETTFRFYARRYLCKECHKQFNLDRKEALSQFPEFVRLLFHEQCGVHTRKQGVSQQVISLLSYCAASPDSLSAVPKIISELQGDRYANTLNIYSAYDSYDRSNPTAQHLHAIKVKGLDIRNRTFLSFSPEEFGVSCLNRHYVSEIFQQQTKSRLEYFQRRQASISCSSLSGDATFEVAKRYLAPGPQGDHRQVSIYSFSNEYHEIVDQAPISGCRGAHDALVGDLSSAEGMISSVACRLKDSINMINTDNCCADKSKFCRHFPHLQSKPPTGQFLTENTPSSFFPDNGIVVDIDSANEAQACLLELLNIKKPIVVGLDIEWFWKPLNGKQRRTSLVQLSFNDGDIPCVYLIHLAEFSNWSPDVNKRGILPSALVSILNREDIKKVGLGISNDLKKLARDFKIDISNCRNCIDLGALANSSCPSAQMRKWSLAGLCFFTLGRELSKPDAIRCSDWEVTPLSPAQHAYAVDDAWVSLEIYQAIQKMKPPVDAPHSLPISTEDRVPHFSENGVASADAVPKFPDSRGPTDRLQDAAKINNHGLDLQSNWLTNPPVEDVDFVARLNMEKKRPHVFSRIKLDPFHWMDRYLRVLSKSHVLYGLFVSCLRDALFFLDQGDMELLRKKMVDRGMDLHTASRLPKSFFTKRNRCRRSIPPRLELAVRVQSVFELFDGLVDSENIPLITDRTRTKHRQCMEHVWAGCLSDIPGVPMYIEVGNDGGLPRYITVRGTSQLECYHRWLRACISGSRISPELFRLLLANFNFRWNVRCGVKNRGFSDLRTYSHWVLEEVSRRSGAYSQTPIIPGLVIPTSRVDLEKAGIDVSSIGFHTPRTEQKKSDSFNESDEDETNSLHDSSDDVSDTSSNDEDELEGTELNPVDLTELKQSICGDGPHAPVLSMAPVCNIAEVALVVNLAKDHLRHGKGKRDSKRKLSVDYASLSAAYNNRLHELFISNKKSFQGHCLRLKSPAHIKAFFERAETGLVQSASLAGVKNEFIELRRRLRDDGPEIPAALKPGGNAGMINEPMSVQQRSSSEEPGKRHRKERTCLDCARNGRGRFLIRQVGNGKGGTPMKYVCTNPRCSQFEETVPSNRPKTNGQFMRQRIRHCTHCRHQGLVF